jgi:hypothetical protein
VRAPSALRTGFRSCHAVEWEMAIAALALIAWELARLPLEGSPNVSVQHARSWLRLEDALGLDIERPFIDFGSTQPWQGMLEWAYGAIHTPAIFAFLAAACLLAPDRYPRLRTIFILSFIPAILVVGLYPLAPPHWLPELGLGPTPTQYELTGTLVGIFQNSTAAAASQHFGFAAFIAAGSLWLFPRSPLAWATLAYPAIVFVVIVGTANHYVLDCLVGALTFVLATAAAFLVHRCPQARIAPALPRRTIVVVVSGYALLAVSIDSLGSLGSGDWRRSVLEVTVLVAGVAAVLSPRIGSRPIAAEV